MATEDDGKLSDFERQALKDRAAELRKQSSRKGGSKKEKDLQDVLDTIEGLPEPDKQIAQMIHEVMKQTKGKWPGPQQFIKMMQGLKLQAVRGPVRFDDMRNPVQNIYIKKVEKKKMFGYPNEELWNTVIKTYPDVGQFWKYKKADYLKTPLYSRDFPPCKYCE